MAIKIMIGGANEMIDMMERSSFQTDHVKILDGVPSENIKVGLSEKLGRVKIGGKRNGK